MLFCTAVSQLYVSDPKAMSSANVARQTAKTDNKKEMPTADRQRVVPDTTEEAMEGEAAGGQHGAGLTTSLVVAISPTTLSQGQY